MFKEVTLCICDVCGQKAEAERVGQTNYEYYPKIPQGWEKSPVNDQVHLCPQCQKVIQKYR